MIRHDSPLFASVRHCSPFGQAGDADGRAELGDLFVRLASQPKEEVHLFVSLFVVDVVVVVVVVSDDVAHATRHTPHTNVHPHPHPRASPP